MARYRALRRHWIFDRFIDEGQVFDYDGIPGRWLFPIDGAAKKAKADAEKVQTKRRQSLNKAAVDRGEDPPFPDDGFAGPFIEPDPSPPLIKSHPILPNIEGSSGERTGESPVASPEAKGKRQKAVSEARSRKAAARRYGRPGRPKKEQDALAKELSKVTPEDMQADKPQGASGVQPDEQGRH